MDTGRRFRDRNIQKTFNSKIKAVFGDGFVLDQAHIKQIFMQRREERDQYEPRFEQVLTELSNDPKYKDVKPWKPDPNWKPETKKSDPAPWRPDTNKKKSAMSKKKAPTPTVPKWPPEPEK